MLRYKCLVLDHDDTTVKSTPEIHYPQWLESLAALRPGTEMDMETFVRYTFEMGFFNVCRDIVRFTPEETDIQYKMWLEYTRSHHASFYEGMGEIIGDFQAQGGLVCVSSHSCDANIIADYRHSFSRLLPDRIYSCDLGRDKIKPDPFALTDIMERYGLRPEEILMVDDMKSGRDMALAAGVPFACAGWSHFLPEIRHQMQSLCGEMYFSRVSQLREELFA